jgi:anti-anti-sigma factor
MLQTLSREAGITLLMRSDHPDAREGAVLFDVERAAVPGRTVLRAVGELDLTTAEKLTEATDAELVLQPPLLVLDLSPTTFMDSSGARAVARLGRKAQREGVAVTVVCPRENSAVRLVIDLLELRAIVPVSETLPRPATGIVAGDDAP